MKNITYILLLVLGVVVISSCGSDKQNKKETEETAVGKEVFTCPMHPQIKHEGPGSCPICGMDLVPASAAGDGTTLKLSERQIQLANIRTETLRPAAFNTSKALNGRLVSDPQGSKVIASRYAGRIDRLFIQQTGVQVSAGQALFQIYSEQLQVLQQDYLLQLKQVAAFPQEKIYRTLRDAAMNKLRLYGYQAKQISALAAADKVSPLITVYAESSGVVTTLNVTQGQYIEEGTTLMQLDDLHKLWLEADVYPSEVNSIKVGTTLDVGINGFAGKTYKVKVDFIAPQLDPATQILKIRAPFTNNEQFQAGMQATVWLPQSQVSHAISLPLDAVIREENASYAWIKTGKGTFSPRKVTTAEEDDSKIVVTSGLDDAKEVVVSGTYLLNSEFILKRGAQALAMID